MTIFDNTEEKNLLVEYAVEHKLHQAYRNEDASSRYDFVTHCVEITDELLKCGITSYDDVEFQKGDFLVFTNTPQILTEYYCLEMVGVYYESRDKFLATHTELYPKVA